MRSVGSWGLMTAVSGVREEGLSGLRWSRPEPPVPHHARTSRTHGSPAKELFPMVSLPFYMEETEVQLGQVTSPRLVAKPKFSPRTV